MKPAAPAPTPAPAPTDTPPRGRPRLALALVALGLVAVVLAVVMAVRNQSAQSVEAIAAEMVAGYSEGLPRDYGNGLVLERIVVEDREIVMIMRSTRLSLAAAARDPVAFTQARRDEQEMMRPFCNSPPVRKVLGHGLGLTRRFLDNQDRMFFEARLTAADCR